MKTTMRSMWAKVALAIGAVGMMSACGSPAQDASGYYRGTSSATLSRGGEVLDSIVFPDDALVIVPREDSQDEVYLSLLSGCQLRAEVKDGELDVPMVLCPFGVGTINLSGQGKVDQGLELTLRGSAEGPNGRADVEMQLSMDRKEL